MNFQEENDKLLWNILDTTFFRAWREPNKLEHENWNKVELIINSICNLKCKYCYLAKYGEELIPSSPKTKVLKNLSIFLNFLRENDLHPKSFEIFSGEPLVQDIGLSVLEQVVDFYKDERIKPSITIPTNGTVLLYPKKFKRLKEILRKSEEYSLRVFLSFSIDGKYCESNRPFRVRGKVRDDKYYDRLFQFAKEHNYSFHPMIYSEKIETWKDNFLWFQSMYEKYKIPWWWLYLLEVRNPEWSTHQIIEFMKFLNFLVKWSWNKCNRDPQKFVDFIFKLRGFNILNIFSTCGRGMPCSIQSTLHLRLGDLAIVPCHRTSYPAFIAGYFKVKDNKIVGVKAHNIETYLTILTLDNRNLPLCENCMIRNTCSKGCLGSQYETTGDLFSPIPTVCLLEHAKVIAIAEALDEIGMLERLIRVASNIRSREIKRMYERWKEIVKKP